MTHKVLVCASNEALALRQGSQAVLREQAPIHGLTSVMLLLAEGAKLGFTERQLEAAMAWNELFTSDAGLMSLAVIVVTLGIGAYMFVRFRAFMREEAKTRR